MAEKKKTETKKLQKKAVKKGMAEAPKENAKDYSKTILYPSMTEKVVRGGEHNKIGFIVSRNSDKKMIREAVESLYGVKVASVQTHILPDGRKRAYVRLTADFSAAELATKLGML